MNSRRKKRLLDGFTLIELLVVIAVIAMLISIVVPSLQKAKESARRIVCSGGQHNIGLGLIMYADANEGKFPQRAATAERYGMWLWDINKDTADTIMNNTGENKDIFYCPSNRKKELRDIFWNSGSWRITHYFWMMPVLDANRNPAGIYANPPQGSGGKKWVSSAIMKGVSHLELVTDAVLAEENSSPNAQYPYGNFNNIKSGIQQSSWGWHMTNHCTSGGEKCYGGNILYVDGHIEWRTFDKMEKRIPGAPFASPTFWW